MTGNSHSTLNQVAGDQNNFDIHLRTTVNRPIAVHTLPVDTAAFTGRAQEINRIVTATTDATHPGRVIAVHAIDGMPGIGKTALAVHVGHLVADKFPERCLFVNLHAHTPGRQPTSTADALTSLLVADGVDPRYLPDDLEGRAALWRDRMARRRALVILDNAASTQQVVPLLPASPHCLVLVTSRRRLSGLRRRYGAVTLTLGTLPEDEAVALFSRIAGRGPVKHEHAAAAGLVRLCAYLPLAVSILAATVESDTSLARLLAVLENAQDRLSGVDSHLDDDELGVRAAFDLSHQNLDPEQQRVLGHLGLVPGADIDAYAAAALACLSVDETRRHLQALHAHRLLEQPHHGRYRMHDLIRDYARTEATTIGERDQAIGRLLDYYQYTAQLADTYLDRHPQPVTTPIPVPAPAAAPGFRDRSQAQAWMTIERANLLACIQYATTQDQHLRVVGLTAAIAAHLRTDGSWALAISLHTSAANAAHRLTEQLGEATALNNLGDMEYLVGNFPAASTALEQALTIFRDIGERLGEADALHHLGAVRSMTGDFPAASAALEQALTIYRDLGNRAGEAHTLNHLGEVRYLIGDFPAARAVLKRALAMHRDLGNRAAEADALNHMGAVLSMAGAPSAAGAALEQALTIFRDIGDQLGEVESLNPIASLHLIAGDPQQARFHHHQALQIARTINSTLEQARALEGIGRCELATSNMKTAITTLRQALGIYQRMGTAEAPRLAAELNILDQVHADS
nr:tetratricopeptide repeat protein [Micromonospora tarapacensis]